MQEFVFRIKKVIFENKWLLTIAVLLSIFFIFKLGKAIGEFIYFINH